MAATIQGVTVRAGVVLTAGLAAYLRALRGSLDPSVPLTVTSGVRSASAQADAMLKKLQAGGAQELYDVYASDATVRKLLDSGRDAATWARIIKAETAKGIRLSRHLGGGSLDIHTATLSAAQVDKIKAAVKATGGSYLYEDAPPHLHVDVPLKFATGSVVEVAEARLARAGARAAHSPWAWGFLGVTTLGVAAVLILKSKKEAPHAPQP